MTEPTQYGAVHTDGSRSGGQPVGTNAASEREKMLLAALRKTTRNSPQVFRTLVEQALADYAATPAPAEAPAYPEGTTPELVERAFGLAQSLATSEFGRTHPLGEIARAIIAEREANIAAARPDPLVAVFEAMRDVQCAEGETWAEKMARTFRAEGGMELARKGDA